MDFLHRNANNQPQATRPASNSQAAASASVARENNKKINEPERWLRIIFVVLLFSGTILLLAIAGLLYMGKDKESQYVNKDKNQAVFLTNGQVYFGKVASVTDEYINLVNIYYLNSQEQSATDAKANTAQTNFSLVKLGCELHGPADQMLINRSQVSFWENLSDTGKVSKAIEQFKSQNPNGQTCTDTTNSTQQSTPTTDTTKKQ